MNFIILTKYGGWKGTAKSKTSNVAETQIPSGWKARNILYKGNAKDNNNESLQGKKVGLLQFPKSFTR